MTSDPFLPILCFTISIFFFVIGFLVHSGRFKGWWLNTSTPVTPTGMAYASIPAGFLYLCAGILFALPIAPVTRGDLALYLLTPLMIITIVLATWHPRWLKPKWLRWLEENHGSILHLLREDAKNMGKLEWDRQVRTQKELEDWVADVLHKQMWFEKLQTREIRKQKDE